MKRYNYNKEFFYNETPELAYFLGFFMADGHLVWNNGGRYELNIEINTKDIEILNKFVEWICPGKPLMFRSRNINETICNVCRLYINDKTIVSILLEKYGILQNKTGNEKLLFKDRASLFSSFIRGLFDGDGSVLLDGDRAYVDICSASLSLLEEIKKYFGYGNINKVNTIHSWKITNTGDVKKFIDFIYTDDCFTLKRKKEKLMSANLNSYNTEYTDLELLFIKENANSMTSTNIGKYLNRTVFGVQAVIERENLRNPKKIKYSKEELNIIKQLLDSNASTREIIESIPYRTKASVKAQIHRIKAEYVN